MFIFQTKRSVDEPSELTEWDGRKGKKNEYHVSDHTNCYVLQKIMNGKQFAPFEEMIFHFKNVGLHILKLMMIQLGKKENDKDNHSKLPGLPEIIIIVIVITIFCIVYTHDTDLI